VTDLFRGCARCAIGGIIDAGEDVMHYGAIARKYLDGTHPHIAPDRIGDSRILVVDHSGRGHLKRRHFDDQIRLA